MDLNEAEMMEEILDMLMIHKPYADTLFHDTESQMPDTGYFGNGGGQKMRTSNNYAMYYAFLYRELPGTKYMPEDTSGVKATRTSMKEDLKYAIEDREAFLRDVKEKAIKAIRYGTYTHNSVKKMATIEAMATDSGKWWGPNNWQSSLYANTLLLAASFMWDELDVELKKDVEKVAAAEGDRAVRTVPKNYTPGNTGAEENSWDTNGPALAYSMFPKHEKAESWNNAAIKFAMNAMSREADANDGRIVDGKPASKWITTKNLFDDYSLENHNLLHPTYIMCPLISFADSAVAYAYHGMKIPDAFRYNLKEVFDNVCKKLVYPTGEWAYPNGCDWTLDLPGRMEAFAYVSITEQDSEAKLLEIRSIQMAKERQKISGDGRFVHVSDLGIEREAVTMKRVLYTYLLHKYVGRQPAETVTWEQFIENNSGTKSFLDGFVVTNHNRERFASFSWKNKYMGLVTPNSNEYLENGYVSHPNLPNIVGSQKVNGANDSRSYGNHRTYPVGPTLGNGLSAGYSTIGYLEENGGAVRRYIAMTALPGNAVVVMDRTYATRDLTVTSGYVLPISFETDVVSGEKKTITTAAGTDSFVVERSMIKSYRGNRVLVDGHTGVLLDREMDMVFGGYTVSSGIAGMTLRFQIEAGQYTKGGLINGTTGIIYSNLNDGRLKELQTAVRHLEMPTGWQGVALEDSDGTRYYVINNFDGGKGIYHYDNTTGLGPKELGVPVLFNGVEVSGTAATAELAEGMASYVGELCKYIRTDDGKRVQVSNGTSADVFYVRNMENGSLKIDVSFVKNGKTITDSFTLSANATVRVFLKNGNVNSEKAKEFPT